MRRPRARACPSLANVRARGCVPRNRCDLLRRYRNCGEGRGLYSGWCEDWAITVV